MAEVEIVRATWRDARTLGRLDRAWFPPADAFGWLNYLSLLFWPGGVALKAVAGERIVGFVAGDPRRRQGFAIIVTLGVDPAWRRRGIGEQLMRECEARFDLLRFRLQVRQSNAAAIRLYRRLGYTILGDLPHYYGDGEDGYLMEKAKTPGFSEKPGL